MADAVERALLLLGDMVDLRSMRKHEAFLNLKRDLALVSSLTAPFTPPLFLILIIIFVFPNHHISSPSKGCLICV